MRADVAADEGVEGEDGRVLDEIAVVFRNGLPPGIATWIESIGGEILLSEPDLSWVSARFDSQEDAEGAIQSARQRADVVFADHDRIVRISGHEFVPNDQFYPHQWGYPAIGAPGAWATTLGTHNISVAVMDTGIDGLHADLSANLCGPHKSYTALSPLTDKNGHGTHTAGTVAAVTNNTRGVSGLSQSCLMSVKVLDHSGQGQESWLASGINWAAQNGADVISMSVASPMPLPLVEGAAKIAYNDGIILIAAAGNDGCDAASGHSHYPARYPTTIAVAALRPPGDETSMFSSCGPEIEVSAPGEDILSTVPHSYGNASGTSQATPHVSGTIALMKFVAPDLQPSAIRSILNNTADDIGDAGWDVRTGWGRLNATAAMVEAAGP